MSIQTLKCTYFGTLQINWGANLVPDSNRGTEKALITHLISDFQIHYGKVFPLVLFLPFGLPVIKTSLYFISMVFFLSSLFYFLSFQVVSSSFFVTNFQVSLSELLLSIYHLLLY
jgi:hypothetical protein